MSTFTRKNRLSASGPWLRDEVAANLPHMRREFDDNRDPLIKKQIADLDKTEAERRRDQESGTQSGDNGDAGRGSDMVKKEKHWFIPRPPQHIREDVDRAQFKTNWLLEQVNAVTARAEARSDQDHSLAQDHSRAVTQPSRRISHDLDM